MVHSSKLTGQLEVPTNKFSPSKFTLQEIYDALQEELDLKEERMDCHPAIEAGATTEGGTKTGKGIKGFKESVEKERDEEELKKRKEDAKAAKKEKK